MTFDRPHRRWHVSLLLFLLGFIGVIALLNYRSSLVESTYITNARNNDIADTVSDHCPEPIQAAPIVEESPPVIIEGTDELEKELDSAASYFKDELYSKVTYKERVYDRPSQKVMDAIERNFIDKVERTLLIAVVNHGMLEYTLNWIESLKRTDITKFLVFAIDQALVDALTNLGLGSNVVLIPDNWRHVQLSGDFAAWKTNSYTPITHAKSLIVERLLYLDVTVWFSDVDIVFVNPNIYTHLMWNLKSRKNVHMVFSQETQYTSINSGFYLMRPTDVSKRVMGRSIDIQDRVPALTQQRIMNRVLAGMDQKYKSSPMILLDLMLFPNGHFYFGRKLPTSLGFEPMMVHANYRIGDAKKAALKEVGLWFLD
ncbi:nucleotide-diphospho-sugar transferase-domain-containing protein, partial [Umbelopsis sp. AD052]